MRIALLHGFAGDARAWDDVVAAWPGGDELVALALPGHGGGEVRLGWDANLDTVAAAVASAGVDAVVGYSLGARIALGLLATGRAYRARRADRRQSRAGRRRPRCAARRRRALGSDAADARGLAAFLDAWEAQPLFATQAGVPVPALAARRARRRALDAEQLARVLEHMGLAEMPDYRATVGRASLVAGAEDAKYLAIARDLGVACRTITRSGHDPTLEQPEVLAPVLRELL